MTQNRLNKRIPLNQEILASIAKIDQFQEFWQGSLKLSPQILGRLKTDKLVAQDTENQTVQHGQIKFALFLSLRYNMN
ncbi:MAG: hypothetical protein WC157_01795 [Candidatus Paceibacterota bacterium]